MATKSNNKKTCAEPNRDILVNHKYRLLNEIGRGSFGVVYCGFELRKCAVVAIKFEDTEAVKKQHLSNEYNVYKLLHGGPGIPECHWFGTFDRRRFNVLVMELLGPSLEDRLTECRREFSLKTVLMLADQIITIVEFLHHRNIIHRDLKPENFVMGFTHRMTEVFLIDFGLAKQYRSSTSNVHIEYRANYTSLTGTARYASLNNHLCVEQSRRDDLETIAYMLIYFLQGSLPWQGIKIKDRVAKYKLVYEKKKSISMNDLCGNNPKEFEMFLNYCRKLSFSEDPDYKYIKKLFHDLFHKSGFKHDLVFDWLKKNSSCSSSVTSSPSRDTSDTGTVVICSTSSEPTGISKTSRSLVL